MTSGIYQLTFPDGRRYIGKSINVEERWAQHVDKMQKGTAAKNMQEAWNKFLTFDSEVIFECHPDHIDIMEECLISRIQPELNGTRPNDRLPGIHGETFHNIIKYFRYSTVDHINTMLDLQSRLNTANTNIENLEESLEEAETQRTKEEIEADVAGRIKSLEEDCELLVTENEDLILDIKSLRKQIEYLNRPWWKKLFG